MRQALDFYRMAVKEAASDTFDRANLLATIVGGALVWLAIWYLGRLEMDAPTSVGGTIGFAIGLALASLVVMWIVIFLFRLFGAPGRMLAKKNEKIAELYSDIETLNQKLKPRIKWSFSTSDPGCKRPNTTITATALNNVGVPIQARVPCDWFRIKVEADCGVAVSGCKGRLIEIRRGADVIVAGEDLTLPFAPGERDEAIAKTIYPSVPEYLDFLAITHANQVVVT
jgi:hypothetical protein